MGSQDEPMSSISKTAAWVEKIELQPQHHHQSTSEQIAPRAVQEMEQPQQKKPKQKEDHDGPDAKSQKYDRQLRLWGANGQKALEEAHVLLVNNGCGTVGIEALKNLVLPGIGNFTIVDSKLVTEEDLGVNFFLDESQLGQPRGKCLRDMLCELNPDVTGHWAQQLGDLSQYDLFIRTTPSMDIPWRNALEEYSHEFHTPLITINSQGFYAYFHIQFSKDFPIVETHPEETALRDFRILNPWPELEKWAKNLTRGLEGQSNHKHGHVPWLALILYYINVWRDTHLTADGDPGVFTGSYEQKKELRKMIQAAQRYDNGEGGEENFDQAFANVMTKVRQPQISAKVREIFAICDEESNKSSPATFWHLARGLKAYYEKNQRMPIAGFVPDMKAESEVFVQLQNLYKAQARKDIEEVKAYIDPAILAQPGVEDEVAILCKNAEMLHVIRESAFLDHESKEEGAWHFALARAGLAAEKSELASLAASNSALDPDTEPLQAKPPLEYILLALRSMETWRVEDMRDIDPATIAGAVEDFVSAPTSRLRSYEAKELALSPGMKGVVREVQRSQGGELHNTAALVGGLVAQEAIKVVTRQYVPVENLVVWDGIFCRLGTFKM